MATNLRAVSVLLLSVLACDSALADEIPQPLIVAHRGLLKHAPENTLANFRSCLELRLGFEFDVQRTKDGELVCIHDDTVDRTTNGNGKVAELTLAEIRELDAGGWFDKQFRGERVPTVDEVLALVAEYRVHDVLIAADLKAVDVEVDVLRLAEKHRGVDRLLFIGRTITEPEVRRRLRAAAAEAHIARVANAAAEFAPAVSDQEADWVYVRYLPSRDEVEQARRAKKRMFIAGPSVAGELPDNWRHAADVGVDGVLTDYPLELRLMLKEEHE